ncbi:hypothetical protein, partial [Plasticicumulans sp.]|uniref:hypothetical protein n=1 Tax=Plasticicumulans sp. TaxID=2307179 RepID=UPI002BA9B7E5
LGSGEAKNRRSRSDAYTPKYSRCRCTFLRRTGESLRSHKPEQEAEADQPDTGRCLRTVRTVTTTPYRKGFQA